jgi:hypothetical protein
MALADDTTIVDMAKSIGVADDDVNVLSERAKKLTRGDLLALWGASDTDGAVTAWQNARQGELMATPGSASDKAPTDLSLADIATIQRLFDPARVRSAIAVRDIATLPETLPNARVPGTLFSTSAVGGCRSRARTTSSPRSRRPPASRTRTSPPTSCATPSRRGSCAAVPTS